MARVTIQQGHCFRRSGATGTRDEQRFASTLGPRLRNALATRGHSVALIGADDYIPAGDVFISLHCDGTASKSRRGASIGFPEGYSGALGKAWKRRHSEQGFPGGWLGDNYTIGLRRYYSWPHRSKGATRSKGYRHWHLAEHGTTTNDADHAWLFANVDRCVQAHVDAIGDVVGHPRSIASPPKPDDNPEPAPTLTEDIIMYSLFTFPPEENGRVGIIDHGRRIAVWVDSPKGLEDVAHDLPGIDLSKPRPVISSGELADKYGIRFVDKPFSKGGFADAA